MTNGERGYQWRGTEILLLTTKGRKSGKSRTMPLIHRADGDRWVVIGSKGGWPANPQWFENLMAGPDEATIQVKGDVIPVRASVAEGEALTGFARSPNIESPNILSSTTMRSGSFGPGATVGIANDSAHKISITGNSITPLAGGNQAITVSVASSNGLARSTSNFARAAGMSSTMSLMSSTFSCPMPSK